MAKRAIKNIETPAAETKKASVKKVTETLNVTAGLSSPARRLQNYLDDELKHDHEMAAERWAPGQTVLFVTVTCSAFWAAVWFALRGLIG